MTAAILTLADYAADPRPLVAGVAKALREESRFMDILPFKDMGSLSVTSFRETGMAAPAWRKIGAEHGGVKATKPRQINEMAYSIGNEINVDKVYMMDKSAKLVNPMTFQTKMITRGIARGFCDKVINGVPSDEDNIVGLAYRIANDHPASQLISAAVDGGTGGLDISPDATGLAANTQILIDRLDALLYAVAGSVDAAGKGIYLPCNDTLLLRIQSLFRQSGMLQTTTDTLGRVFLSYKGAQFVDMGYKADETDMDPGTRIMPNTETTAGTAMTGGDATSLYAVKIGDEYLTGWQEYSLDVTEPELKPNKVTYASVIDWMVGIAVTHARSIARLFGLRAA